MRRHGRQECRLLRDGLRPAPCRAMIENLRCATSTPIADNRTIKTVPQPLTPAPVSKPDYAGGYQIGPRDKHRGIPGSVQTPRKAGCLARAAEAGWRARRCLAVISWEPVDPQHLAVRCPPAVQVDVVGDRGQFRVAVRNHQRGITVRRGLGCPAHLCTAGGEGNVDAADGDEPSHPCLRGVSMPHVERCADVDQRSRRLGRGDPRGTA
jgi:hypothetical protein